jgi:glycerophosphoryl diester phosphodiesterase
MTGRPVAAAVCGLLLAAGLTGCATATAVTTVGLTAAASCDATPTAVAHRGGTETSMENTVGAFRSAGEGGIGEWELDVRYDVHGTPVVLHDATVDRVSPRTGAVSGLDATADGGIPTDDGQHIPTLREVYDVARTYRAHVLTELKVMPTADEWATVTADIDETIGRSAVTLMSFDRDTVAEARQRIPGATTALLQEAGFLYPQQVLEFGDSFAKADAAISASRAEQWRSAGIRLYAWTVDTQSGWERDASFPVDAVITDRPIAYRKWADATC